jgi:23S rRNA (uridine2552-2'-O)-methyltransferase
VLAVDLLAMEPLAGAQVVRGDFMLPATQAVLRSLLPAPAQRGAAAAAGSSQRVDVVLSDMAHAFVGDAATDHSQQMALSWSALLFASSSLAQGGSWVCKVRYGSEYAALRAAARRCFEDCLELKPPASRSDSAEAYLVGKGFRGRVGWEQQAAELMRGHGLQLASG